MITKMYLMPPFPAATREKKPNKQDFPGGAVDKNPPDNTESTVQSLVQEDSTRLSS